MNPAVTVPCKRQLFGRGSSPWLKQPSSGGAVSTDSLSSVWFGPCTGVFLFVSCPPSFRSLVRVLAGDLYSCSLVALPLLPLLQLSGVLVLLHGQCLDRKADRRTTRALFFDGV